jgi:FkbM family methyltransferase
MSAILTNSKYGPALVPPYDEYLAKAFIVNGAYGEEEFRAWEPFITKDSLVLDIGANFGSHTFHFAEVAQQVIAFEPQLELYRMLQGSLALQHRSNVIALNTAVGTKSGEIVCPSMDFLRPNNFGGVSLLDKREGNKVPVSSIDGFGFLKCDFIKIDVEGMELHVLIGAKETIRKFRPVMSVEADREEIIEGIYNVLDVHDYTILYHEPPLGSLWENVRSRNFLAIPKERSYNLEELPYCKELKL